MLNLDRQNTFRERYRALRPGWQPSGEVYEATVRHYLTPAARLLDLGCGRGGLPEKLATERRAIFGLDPDWRSLNAYRHPAVDLTAARAEHLPYPAGTFDLIGAAWLFEHLPDPATALLEIHRVLAPGGHCVFLTPNANHPLLVANRLSRLIPSLQRLAMPHLYGRAVQDTFPVHYRANTPRRLRHLSEHASLQLIQQRFISDPTYLAFNDSLFRLAVNLERLTPHRLWVHLVGVFEKVRSEPIRSSIG